MAKLNLIETIQTKLSTLSKKDGQLIVVRDNASLHIDLDGNRIYISDWIDVSTDEERLAMLTPLNNKYYYVVETNKIWRYISGQWVLVTKSFVDENITIAGLDLKDDITTEELVSVLGINDKANSNHAHKVLEEIINDGNSKLLLSMSEDGLTLMCNTKGGSYGGGSSDQYNILGEVWKSSNGISTLHSDIWKTTGYKANLQVDGNFVISDLNNNVVWSSNAHKHNEIKSSSGNKVVIQDDKNLVAYDAEGNPIWASMSPLSWGAVTNVEAGNVGIAPTALNVVTSVTIAFNKTFTRAPHVVVTPQTSSPDKCFASVDQITQTGCRINLYRTDNVVGTQVHYIAMAT